MEETIEEEAYPSQIIIPKVNFDLPPLNPPKYNIVKDLNRHHANITFGQLLDIPEVDTQMRTYLNQKDQQVNINESPNVKAAARIYVSVKNNPIHAIVDSGAGMSIISLNLLRQLQIKMDPNTNISVKGLLGPAKGFCGTAKIPIRIQDAIFTFNMFVLETPEKQQTFLLGNDWCTHYAANLNYKTQIITLETAGRKYQVEYTISNEKQNYHLAGQPETTQDEVEAHVYESTTSEWKIDSSHSSNEEDELITSPTPSSYMTLLDDTIHELYAMIPEETEPQLVYEESKDS